MSNKLGVILGLLLALSITLFSCEEEKEYGGEDVINYPDLESLFLRMVDTELPLNYLFVRQTESKKDSSDMPYGQVPWKELKTLFADANLKKEALDRKYSISILTDTVANTRTLYYEALDPKVSTRSLSITSSLLADVVENIYFDYEENNSSNDVSKRVLLRPNNLIQIQRRSGKETIVDSYYYP